MSRSSKRRRRVETLASISDTEAEFWTCSVGSRRDKVEKTKETIVQDPLNDILSPNGLYFKSNNELNETARDQLELLFKENLAKQAEEVAKEAENKPLTSIFQFDDNIILNENIPGVNMSFLDRLVHQLTRSSLNDNDYFSDEEFTDIDSMEITSVVNEYIDKAEENEKSQLKGDDSFERSVRSFLEELLEEADVILGTLRLDAFIRRRCEKAKLSTQFDGQFSREKSEITSFL